MNAANSVMPRYGALSKRSLDEMIAGARVDVAPYKRDNTDFVLWKPAKPGEPSWPSPAGITAQGRPGWHIECSAMAWKHLGEKFDIHGGGIDLVFPHHENELAQTCCAFHSDRMANVWMHNGFLQLESEKMSKSLGNFFTIREMLADWPGEVLRLSMLKTHYRSPLDWTAKGAEESAKTLDDWYAIAADAEGGQPSAALTDALYDDLNTAQAMAGAARPAQCGGVRRRARTRRVCGVASAARIPVRECGRLEGAQAAGERHRCRAGRSAACGPYRRAGAKGLQGVRSDP